PTLLENAGLMGFQTEPSVALACNALSVLGSLTDCIPRAAGARFAGRPCPGLWLLHAFSVLTTVGSSVRQGLHCATHRVPDQIRAAGVMLMLAVGMDL
ncbi:MAG TPA: hypothetical protein PK093_00005, partial [Phycisphaerae bacterium]|nr:hypothetical protein [Phycisphaerae bacterium]